MGIRRKKGQKIIKRFYMQVSGWEKEEGCLHEPKEFMSS